MQIRNNCNFAISLNTAVLAWRVRPGARDFIGLRPTAAQLVSRRGRIQEDLGDDLGDEFRCYKLGDGEFVDNVIFKAKEAYERKYRLRAKGLGLDDIAGKAAQIIGIDPGFVWIRGKQPKVVQARSLFCYRATNELGISQAALSKRPALSPSAVSIAVARGRELVKKHNYSICNRKSGVHSLSAPSRPNTPQ